MRVQENHVLSKLSSQCFSLRRAPASLGRPQKLLPSHDAVDAAFTGPLQRAQGSSLGLGLSEHFEPHLRDHSKTSHLVQTGFLGSQNRLILTDICLVVFTGRRKSQGKSSKVSKIDC